MAELFRTGDGSVTDKIIVALELVDNDWFRRNFIHALELMCEQFNWEQVGDADVDFARDKSNEMLESVVFDVIIPQIPIGTINMWAANTYPDKWLLCDGQAVSRTTYAELFDVISDTYGDGDGSTTFELPNFKDRSPMGVGVNIVSALAQEFGAQDITLTEAQLASHAHLMARIASSGGSNLNSQWTANTVTHGTPATTAAAGGGQAHNNVHPILAVKFIIYAGI